MVGGEIIKIYKKMGKNWENWWKIDNLWPFFRDGQKVRDAEKKRKKNEMDVWKV